VSEPFERGGETTPRVPGGRRVVVGLVATLLVGVGVVLLIAKAAGFGHVRDAIAAADSTWFLACFFAECVSFAAYAVVVRNALRVDGGPDAGFGLSAHVTLASLGATRIVAAAGVGGIAVTYWCFRRARLSTHDAFVRVLGLNTLVYLVFGLGAWVAALLVAIGGIGETPPSLTLPWLVVIPICLAGAGYVTQATRVRRLSRTEGGGVLRRGFGYAISGTAWVRDVLPTLEGRRSLAAATLYWSGDALCLWAALRSVGVSLDPATLVLAYATGYAAMLLPLPFGGVGGVDAAMTYALTVVGVGLAPALVAVAVYRLFGFWVPTIPALAALALLPRAGRGLERAAAVGPTAMAPAST
jgi:uncharacterized membrane protein YbhN (UPF0104 family)